MEEVFILDRAALEVMPFHLRPREPIFCQLDALRFWHRALARLLDYCYYCLVTTRQERQPHKFSSTRHRFKELRTLMNTFDGVDSITIFHFLSRYVEKCDPEKFSEVSACILITKFFKEKALDHFLSFRNALSYAQLRYWPECAKYILSA